MSKMLRAVPRGPSAQISVGSPTNNLRAYGNPIPYIAPWAVALALFLLAFVERLTFRRDAYSWYWSVFVAVVYGTLTIGGWWASRPRGALTCTITTGGLGAASAWTWYLIGIPETGFGHIWRPAVVYWGGAFAVCGVSMIWSASKSARGDGTGPGWLDNVGKAVAQVRGVNAVHTTPTGEVVAEYRMQPGTPAAALQQDADVLAALIPGMRPDGVKVLPSRDDATAGTMRLNPIDRLREPVPWPGPSIPWGGTAAEPVRLGVREAGGWSELYLTADPEASRVAPIVALVGMAGAGKTELLLYLLLEILSRFDTEYWLGDTRKLDQLPDWAVRGATRTAAGKRDVARMVRDFEALVPERAKLLGAHGCRYWRSDCCYAKHGIKLLVFAGDEFAGVASDLATTLTNVAESVRSVGMVPVLAFQRATGDRFPTSARSQFNAHICLGVQDENDAAFGALPEDVLDAGAQPWLWQANAAGMHINATPGVPAELRATNCRTFDPRGKAALMASYAEQYIAARATGATPQDVRPAPDEAAEYGDTEHAVAEMLADDLEADDDLELGDLADEMNAELDPQDAADLANVGPDDDLPVPGPPPETIALPVRMAPAAARRLVYEYLLRLADAGARQFRVADHIETLYEATGLKSTWMYGVAAEFCEPSDCGPAILRQIEERGPYDLVVPAREIEAP